MKKTFLFLLLVIMTCSFSFARQRAIEMVQGNLKVTLYPEINRFALYYLADPARNKFVPMISNLDPRTTSMKLRISDKVIDLSDTGYFTSELTGSPNEAKITYTSEEIIVVQKFSFVRSHKSQPADGVLIEWTVEYLGMSKVNAGLRFVLDTNMGEGLGIHFSTDVHPRISSEIRLFEDYKDTYLISGDKDSALLVQFSGEGLIRPESIVFANWKRLDNTIWDYTLMEGRNFNQLPYSVNDSAVAFYWPSKRLATNEKMYANIILGLASSGGFGIVNQTETNIPPVQILPPEPDKPFEAEPTTEEDITEENPADTPKVNETENTGLGPVTAEPPVKPFENYDIDKMTIDQIISRIDFLMQNPNSISENEIEKITNALQKLSQ